MKQKKTPLILKIVPYLGIAEKIFLTGLAVGLIVLYFNVNEKMVAQFSLAGLAITYFLSAFRIIEIPRTEGEKFGFKELLCWTIIPKILGIGAAFSLLGILVYSFHLGHQGHMRALTTGSFSIAIGLATILFSSVTGTKSLSILTPILVRAGLVMLASFYFIWLTTNSNG